MMSRKDAEMRHGGTARFEYHVPGDAEFLLCDCPVPVQLFSPPLAPKSQDTAILLNFLLLLTKSNLVFVRTAA